MELIDISKASTTLARERKTGKPVLLYVGFDIEEALKAFESADPVKYDQVITLRKPPGYKRRQFAAPIAAQEEKPEPPKQKLATPKVAAPKPAGPKTAAQKALAQKQASNLAPVTKAEPAAPEPAA